VFGAATLGALASRPAPESPEIALKA